MEKHWATLRPLLPEDLANLSEEDVANWLRGHLQRVIANQKATPIPPLRFFCTQYSCYNANHTGTFVGTFGKINTRVQGTSSVLRHDKFDLK